MRLMPIVDGSVSDSGFYLDIRSEETRPSSQRQNQLPTNLFRSLNRLRQTMEHPPSLCCRTAVYKCIIYIYIYISKSPTVHIKKPLRRQEKETSHPTYRLFVEGFGFVNPHNNNTTEPVVSSVSPCCVLLCRDRDRG